MLNSIQHPANSRRGSAIGASRLQCGHSALPLGSGRCHVRYSLDAKSSLARRGVEG